MDGRAGPDYARVALSLADLHEELDVMRYPSRIEMLRAVEEAMRRAEVMARLELVLSAGADWVSPRAG
jgi:hypothetical protein